MVLRLGTLTTKTARIYLLEPLAEYPHFSQMVDGASLIPQMQARNEFRQKTNNQRRLNYLARVSNIRVVLRGCALPK